MKILVVDDEPEVVSMPIELDKLQRLVDQIGV